MLNLFFQVRSASDQSQALWYPVGKDKWAAFIVSAVS